MTLLAALLLQTAAFWAPEGSHLPFYRDDLQRQAASQPEPAPQASDRRQVIHGYRTMLRAGDSDRDGRLSRAEWAAMAERHYPANSRQVRRYPAGRIAFLSLHQAMDEDGDGEATFAEMTGAPLRNFDCLDANRDMLVTEGELRRRTPQCPAPRPARTGLGPGSPPR